jgi:hypothetical protein
VPYENNKMAASTKRRITGYDLQNALGAHIETTQRAYAAAEKAITLRQAGKSGAAIKAEREAKKWLSQAIAIERALPPRPQGGRPTTKDT